MYAMPKIHISNNILAKTRRGFPQKLETFEKNLKDNTNFLIINSPKPVFHFNNSKKPFEDDLHTEKLSPQHEEMVKYIQSTWTNVQQQYEQSESKETINDLNSKQSVNKMQQNNTPKIFYFTSKTSSTIPKFEPFDLESFWSQRIYQKLISA